MKSILFLIACSICATCCFAATDYTLPLQEGTQELACGKCNKSSCKGCRSLLAYGKCKAVMLTCGDDEECPCGCGKKNIKELAGCGCKGKGKGTLEIAGCGCKGKGKSLVVHS